MEQSQISIRPNQEYTPPPPLSLSSSPPGEGEGGPSLCSSRSPFPLSGGGGGAARGWCLAGRASNSAKTASKRTAPFLPLSPSFSPFPLLRAFSPSLSSLSSSSSSSSSRIDVLARITTHPRHVPSIRLLAYLLTSFDHRLHSAPANRSARFPRFSNRPECHSLNPRRQQVSEARIA